MARNQKQFTTVAHVGFLVFKVDLSETELSIHNILGGSDS